MRRRCYICLTTFLFSQRGKLLEKESSIYTYDFICTQDLNNDTTLTFLCHYLYIYNRCIVARPDMKFTSNNKGDKKKGIPN